MAWFRKHLVPVAGKILLLSLAVAAATADNLAAQDGFRDSACVLTQSLCPDDPGDSERHPGKVTKYASKNVDEDYLPHLVIKSYLEQVPGLIIPSPPALFFRPDRAPPVSFL